MANTKRAKAVIPTVSDTFQPFHIDTAQPAVDEERVVVFTIDGTEHTIPRRLPACDTVAALEVTATRGSVAGAWEMVKMALGEESIGALMTCRQVTHDQVRGLFDRIGKLYMGQVEDLTGK